MAESQDERLTGDLPVTPTHYCGQEAPTLSHDVIASYVADAARSVPGIVDLHTSHWRSLSSRVRETRSGGVVVKDRDDNGHVDVEIHAQVAWGSVIPEVARQVEEAVRERVTALLNLQLDDVTLFVDDIAGPTEGSAPKED
jgi:uncharacterized alkaline shock family protein YloU